MQIGMDEPARIRQQRSLDTLQKVRDLHQRQQEVYTAYRDLEDLAPLVQQAVNHVNLSYHLRGWCRAGNQLSMHGIDCRLEQGR